MYGLQLPDFTGDHATRERIFADHVSYVMGLWYFLQNDDRLPEDVRASAGRWGLCRDEFQDSGHWPHQLYVREARRMVNDHVMTEHHCRGDRTVEEIMLHRSNIEMIDADKPPEEILSQCLHSAYTRLPIFREDQEQRMIRSTSAHRKQPQPRFLGE